MEVRWGAGIARAVERAADTAPHVNCLTAPDVAVSGTSSAAKSGLAPPPTSRLRSSSRPPAAACGDSISHGNLPDASWRRRLAALNLEG